MARASPGVVAALIASSRALLEILVDDTTTVVAFLEDITDLSDSERTALSGRVGAGITDQTMEMLGFVWRDVAEQLIGSSVALADYVYESATGALVLAEAKGSITSAATQGGADSTAHNAYLRQVQPYVYLSPPGPKGGPSVGFIEHGYALAFAARPGHAPGPTAPPPPAIAADAFLAVAETDPTAIAPTAGAGPGTGTALSVQIPPPPPPARTHEPQSFDLRLGNYRAVFLLANAPSVVAKIDAVLLKSDISPGIQSFVQVVCGDRSFLIGIDPTFPSIDALRPHLSGWVFAVALGPAEKFLHQLANAFNQGFSRAVPVQQLVRGGGEKPPPFIMSPDGFAMLRRDATFETHEVTWNPGNGQITRFDLPPNTPLR
ncbi:hypothetical protein RGR602_PB00022 (plasmid) [Rhizobium gallicum bv. gallicum R602sp]|uniref:Uncharacterized protein n=1 Tax=Rhizobium gallicum bv. gallicum R602sp TaxID=1041138 RepID=A0A0B4X656_9HYPH|nr:hypothetical protein [Rhizobium gallicum]AJD43564.1 hypothetical protein RGR602_PB00022 [Rhizobium gallicum bv. gallicum R602sp]TDW34059.1 hypothetical protein EV128_10466 [Rhizobium azibense]